MTALPVLRLIPGRYAVCRFEPGARPALPPVGDHQILVLARTPGELTLVCPEDRRPTEAVAETGFAALGVCGPLDFSLVGILAGLTAVLAQAGVSVFAVSTYDTDYVLVRAHSLARATRALRAAGYELEGSSDSG